MKIFKFALIACLVATGFTASAQENKKASKEAKTTAIEELNLTEKQRAEIDALKAATKEKVAALKADESLDEAARKEEIKALRTENKAAVDAILTDEQKAQLKEMKANRKDLTPGEIANKKTQKMKAMLDLSPEQEEQVRTLNLKVALKIDVIKKDDTMSDEKKKEFIKGNKESYRSVLETILTPEQMEKYNEHMSAKKALKGGAKKSATSPSTHEKATE